MTGSEAIEYLGKQMFPDFSIGSSQNIYKQIYQKFVDGCKYPEKKDKGFIIVGDIGVGKTTCMKIFHRMFKSTERKFRWITSSTLNDMLSEYTLLEIKEFYGKKCLCDLMIDDVGLVAAQKNYGNVVNVISEIIMERYDLFISHGYRTYFTSNLMDRLAPEDNPQNLPTLETVLGNRVVDRMVEMCDLITWQGDSLRK